MSIGREGMGRTSPKNDAEASEPAVTVAAAPEGVNVPQRERAMPSIDRLNARNSAERSAAEKRESGETPMGNLEVIAKEADARAQETLVAQNTGFVNRVTNVAKKAWTAVSGFMGFLKADIVLPAFDSLKDMVSGRKESGELVGESMQKIDSLQNQIRSSSGAERDALEAQLADEQDHLAYLRDPHNAARDMAEREKAAAAAEKAEAESFVKSEAERIAVENLATAALKVQEAHSRKLEQERIDREARSNLGRAVANLLVKVIGEDPSNMSLSEGQLLALGTIIDGAKRGVVGAINMPGRVKTGLKEYKDGEIAKARDAYRLTKDAIDDVTLGEDRRALWAFTKDAVSFTGAVLMNKDVQQEVLDVLGQEQVFAADEEGNGAEIVKNRGTADVLANAIKDGAVNNMKAMGKAVAEAAREIRDSEAATTAKRAGKNAVKVAGAGATGYAVGTVGMAAAPFVFAGTAAVAPYMLGAATAYGAYRAGKAGMEATKRGYGKAIGAATDRLTASAPAINEAIGPAIQVIANAVNLPRDGRRDLTKLGVELSDTLNSTAESVLDKTLRGVAFYRDLKTRLGQLSATAQFAYNKLQQEALAEAARAKNPALAEKVNSAINAIGLVENAVTPDPTDIAEPTIRPVVYDAPESGAQSAA